MASRVPAVACKVGSDVACDGITKTYLDDRSFSASSATSLLAKVGAWEGVSESVGLESPDKLQLTAVTKQGLQALRLCAPMPLKLVRVLRSLASARFRPSSNSYKEAARLRAALKVITILGHLRLPWERFQREARSFGMAKVAYGWIARCATQHDCWKVWSAIRSRQQCLCLYRANRYLRAVLLGGNAHLDALIGMNLWRLVACMFQDGVREWYN